MDTPERRQTPTQVPAIVVVPSAPDDALKMMEEVRISVDAAIGQKFSDRSSVMSRVHDAAVNTARVLRVYGQEALAVHMEDVTRKKLQKFDDEKELPTAELYRSFEKTIKHIYDLVNAALDKRPKSVYEKGILLLQESMGARSLRLLSIDEKNTIAGKIVDIVNQDTSFSHSFFAAYHRRVAEAELSKRSRAKDDPVLMAELVVSRQGSASGELLGINERLEIMIETARDMFYSEPPAPAKIKKTFKEIGIDFDKSVRIAYAEVWGRMFPGLEWAEFERRCMQLGSADVSNHESFYRLSIEGRYSDVLLIPHPPLRDDEVLKEIFNPSVSTRAIPNFPIYDFSQARFKVENLILGVPVNFYTAARALYRPPGQGNYDSKEVQQALQLAREKKLAALARLQRRPKIHTDPRIVQTMPTVKDENIGLSYVHAHTPARELLDLASFTAAHILSAVSRQPFLESSATIILSNLVPHPDDPRRGPVALTVTKKGPNRYMLGYIDVLEESPREAKRQAILPCEGIE